MNKKEAMKRLTDRYFAGETNEAEEILLRRFLASPAADAPEWDELRAVMGFLSVGRRIHTVTSCSRKVPHRYQHVRYRWVAAFVLILGMTAGYCLYEHNLRNEECVAYIHGKRCTDEDVVMQQMEQTLHIMLEETSLSDERIERDMCSMLCGDVDASVKITNSISE